MRPCIRPLFLVVALAATSCAGSDDGADISTTDATTDATTAVTTAVTTDATTDAPASTEVATSDSEPDVVVTADAAPETDGTETSAGSMSELLDALPLVAYEMAVEQERSTIEVVLVDLSAGAEAVELDRPDPADLDASLDWLLAVTRSQSVEDGGTGLALPFGGMPLVESAAQSDEVAAELGFSIVDVDRWASITAPPVSFATVFGANLAPSPDLADLGDGVLSAGEGADDELSGSPTPLRRLGRPLRLATADGRVAMSTSTPLVSSWLTGDATMAAVENFAVATLALDGAGAVGAHLAEGEFAPFDSGEQREAFSEPFGLVGIGSAVRDGTATSVIVYVFDDEAAAASVQPELDEAWRNGTFEAFGPEPISTFLDVTSVEQQGRTVVVEAAVTDASTTLRVLSVFFFGDPIFSNP